VIVRDAVPLFVRILPIDIPTAATFGHDVTMDVTANTTADVDAAIAEIFETVPAGPRVRLGAGSDSHSHPPIPLAAADLAARVRSTLSFHAGRGDELAVERVLLSGAGAASDGVFDALDAALDAEIVLVSAADVITSEAVQLPEGDAGRDLVSTLGLVIGAEAA
jgi:type IV pilus assembly protein PilM